MADATAPQTDDDEGVHPLPNGMCRLVIDGHTIMLRRVTIGELKRLREAHQQSLDMQVARSHEAQARSQSIQEAWEAQDAALEERAAAVSGADRAELQLARATALAACRTDRMAVSRSLDPLIEEAQIGWLTEAIHVAGIGAPALPDEWPAWCASADVAVTILNHWVTVPSGSGPS